MVQQCTWDLTGDGAMNGFDLLALLAKWGATDFNHDGAINGFDLLALLAQWGACP